MKTITNKVSEKIIKMARQDQKIRLAKDVDYKAMERMDRENRKVVKGIIEKYGLITISRFGKEASYSAWLLIQHFPKEEVGFMENYLKLMESPIQDIDIRNYACLKDRILMYRGLLQIYGTQTNSKTNGNNLEFYPIRDVKNIDELRKKVELKNLKEYAKDLEEMFGKPVTLPRGYVYP